MSYCFEDQLGRLASQAHAKREIHGGERWREVASVLDHARTLVRQIREAETARHGEKAS